MSKDLSEKIAAGFILGFGLIVFLQILFTVMVLPWIYLFGIYAISGMFGVYGWLFFALLLGRIGMIWFSITLLKSYFRHVNGMLSESSVDRMWVITIVYNAIFFFPAFYYNLQCLLTDQCFRACRSFGDCHWLPELLSQYPTLFGLLTLWWTFATFAPFAALWSREVEERNVDRDRAF